MKIEVIGQDAEAVKAVAAKVNAKGFEAKACPIPKHTQGPWAINGRVIGPESEIYVNGSSSAVCLTPDRAASNAGYVEPTPQDTANARLIAAAPELLEALESAKRVLASGNLESQDAEETAFEIGQALAKAKGEQ